MERLKELDVGRNVMPDVTGRVNYHITPVDDNSTLFGELPFKPQVVAAVEQLIGSPVLLWLDQIFLKPARVGVGNTWHTDNTCFKLPDVQRGVGMWIAIHDGNKDNGTLEVIPDSFRWPEVAERRAVLTDYQLINRLVARAPSVPAEIPAGGVVFFNVGLFHCTRDNHSEGQRAALALHFIQADNLPTDEAALAQGRGIPLTR
jgi:ectoine hydroxylase-related dioxygenase (phytanoyl-CoA dioxygenase family)